MNTHDFIWALPLPAADRHFLLLGVSSSGKYAGRIRESIPDAVEAAGVTIALQQLNGLGRAPSMGRLLFDTGVMAAYSKVDEVLASVRPAEGSELWGLVQQAGVPMDDPGVGREMLGLLWKALASCEGLRFGIDGPREGYAQAVLEGIGAVSPVDGVTKQEGVE